jgi:hypothetical protein
MTAMSGADSDFYARAVALHYVGFVIDGVEMSGTPGAALWPWSLTAVVVGSRLAKWPSIANTPRS